MDADQVMILCFRTTNPTVLVVDGASKTKCEDCGHDIWIAPTSRRMRQELKARVICEVCGKKRVESEKVDMVPMTREQHQEIADTLENRKHRN